MEMSHRSVGDRVVSDSATRSDHNALPSEGIRASASRRLHVADAHGRLDSKVIGITGSFNMLHVADFDQPPAVVVNAGSSLEAKLAWALGQLSMLEQIMCLQCSAGDSDVVTDPRDVISPFKSLLEQALPILEAAVVEARQLEAARG
jgi:hypothetical protein